MKTEIFTKAKLQIRSTEGGGRKICGYAIIFNRPSAVLWKNGKSEAREVIDPGAVTKSLLDACDIKMTMFHDRQLILARSNKGVGTLNYRVDNVGVFFEFEAPKDADGDKAVALIKRGDIAGCSFAFTTRYESKEYVETTESKRSNGLREITYRVKRITGIFDFTLTDCPVYPDTSVSARQKQDEYIERAVEDMRKESSRQSIFAVPDRKQNVDWRQQVKEAREMLLGKKRNLIY